MDVKAILTVLRGERQRIDKAIAAIDALSSVDGRPSKKRRGMSAEGRARIAAAKRRWWAQQRKS